MVFDRISGDLQAVTPPELNLYWAQFSPTTALISFATFRPEIAIGVVRPDGSDLRQLYAQVELDNFSWVRDGAAISFSVFGARGICD